MREGVAFWAPRRSLYLGAGSGPWGRGHRAQGAGGLRRPGRIRDSELAAVSVLGSVTRAQFGDQPGLPPGALENLAAVTEGEARGFSVPAPFVWWVAVSPVRQLVTRFFGCEGPFRRCWPLSAPRGCRSRSAPSSSPGDGVVGGARGRERRRDGRRSSGRARRARHPSLARGTRGDRGPRWPGG